MKILVTFAVATEFAAWRRQHGFRQVAREPFPLYAADIGGSAVRVLLTGIGAEAAAAAMRWALASADGSVHLQRFCRCVAPGVRRGRRSCRRVVVRAEQGACRG